MNTFRFFAALIIVIFTADIMALGHATAQNDSLDSVGLKKNQLDWFPIVFWTPDTRFLGGAFLSYSIPKTVHGVEGHPTSIALPLVYTQEHQYMSGLEMEHYWNDERDRIKITAEYVKFFEDFYGIGNTLPEKNKEEFTPRRFSFQANYYKNVSGRFFAGLQYEYEDYSVVKAKSSGLIADMNLKGTTITSGLGLVAMLDTRNDEIYPRSGSFHQVSMVPFHSIIGSEKNFVRTTIDVRQYFRIAKSHVFAYQAYAALTSGHTPMNEMALFGGQNLMRGFYGGRYRDRQMIAAQAEYRLPLFWRFGMTGFAGIGDVANQVGDFRTNDLKVSGGVGLRFALDRKKQHNIRLDLAFGKNAVPAIGIGEAF
ncbi:outer membrane protein assembly factor [bacterium]|nr:outer membrane protein assembly factor [bacterium]